jgi:hypothetical protein
MKVGRLIQMTAIVKSKQASIFGALLTQNGLKQGHGLSHLLVNLALKYSLENLQGLN